MPNDKSQPEPKTVAQQEAGGDCVSRLVSRYLRGAHGCKETALERMISDLWRNYPEWPSTFGPCSEKCGGSGRGSGPCASCVMRAISVLVGDELAACGLRRHIVDARAEARKLRDMISSANADNLEGPGPTEAERRENYKAIQALSIPERFALMFGRNRPTSEIPLDTNPES